MGYELIASGGILDVNTISQYENLLPEGSRSLIELDLRWSPPSWVASELENKLRQAGVEEARVSTSSPRLQIYFKKGFPWLAVIVAIVLGLVTLAILIMAWRIFREVVPASLQPLVGGLGLAVLLVLGIVLIKRRL